MEYAKLKQDGSFDYQITTRGNVEWDATHFCPASALTPEEAVLFRVVPVVRVEHPAYDAITQTCAESGGEFVNGQWQTRWMVSSLDAPTIAANQAAKSVMDAARVAGKIDALWRAADTYTSSYISGVAVGLLTIGVLQSKPKALAVSAWSSAVWDAYYARTALVTLASADDLDFSSFGAMPYSVPELRAELGM